MQHRVAGGYKVSRNARGCNGQTWVIERGGAKGPQAFRTPSLANMKHENIQIVQNQNAWGKQNEAGCQTTALPLQTCNPLSCAPLPLSFALRTFSLYQRQASGLMGSPTDPSTLSELRSYLEMISGPKLISARIAVGAV